MSDSRWTADFDELLNAMLPSFVREAALVEDGRLYRSVMTRIELPLLRQALELSGGNQLRAARLLGINRNTLRKATAAAGAPAPSGTRGSENGRLTADPKGAPRGSRCPGSPLAQPMTSRVHSLLVRAPTRAAGAGSL